MLFYNKQNITSKDIIFVKKSLKSELITKGNYLVKFENELCKTFKSRYALVTSNATSAFYIISKVLNWNKNSNVIISPMTFVAGANSVVSANANIIFVDINQNDQNLNPDLVEKEIKKFRKNKKKIDALIVTDYAGTPADWKKFYKIKEKYKLVLINDNCHAIGSKYHDNIGYAVKYADIVIHSYHPVKNITSGEGGSILTNNKKIYELSRTLREHGFFKKKNKKFWEREIYIPGFNSRLSEPNCALGYSQLKRINKIIKARRNLANIYNKYFMDHKYIKVLKHNSSIKSSYHLYFIMINFRKFKINKSKFFNLIKKKFGIILQVHYVPTYKFKLFKRFVKNDLIKKNFLNTERYYEQTFSIPLHLGLKKKDILFVCKAIDNTLKILTK